MTAVGSPVGKGSKELRTDWPVEEGLTDGTTKQEGRVMNLVPDEDSLVPRKQRVGINN